MNHSSIKSIFGLILVLIILMPKPGRAQKATSFSSVDSVIKLIPDSLDDSPAQIASFIASRFTSDREIARAAFVWTSSNITYDVSNMYTVNFYESIDQVIRETMNSREGVCMGYAHIFAEIVNSAGGKAYVISGYTRQNGIVDNMPHAWCAARVDTSWYLFDPTWSAGYIKDDTFFPKFSDQYFMVRPEEMIRTHMPFDPLFQFLYNPLKYPDFNKGSFSNTGGEGGFNYPDSLDRFDLQDEIDQLRSANARIDRNGTKNSLVFERYQHNQQNIEYFLNKKAVEAFNEAVFHYNEGIAHLNRFINYRNNQFEPKMPDSEITGMVFSAETSLNLANERLSEVEPDSRDVAASVTQLSRSIEEALINLREQQAFLDKYYSTGKAFRKSLFYRYTWMGVPLN